MIEESDKRLETLT